MSSRHWMARPLSRLFRATKSSVVVATCIALASCDGSISDPSTADGDQSSGPNGGPTGGGTGGPGAPVADGWPSFKPSQSFQLRRLTTEQYTASVQTLLGIGTDGMPPIEHISPVGGFSDIGAYSVAVSGMGVGQFENAGRFLAHAAMAATGARQKLVPCTPTGPADATCIQSFVKSFGQRIFRRPLAADEITAYGVLASQVATATADVWQGLEATVSAFLQSPKFLYLTEVGAQDPANAG